MTTFGETITILTGTVSTDRYSDDTIDWTTPTEVEVPGCAVAPRTSSEVNDGRTAVIIGLTAYLPAGTQITPSDRVRVRGADYTVDGQPGDWRDPYDGEAAGIEVALGAVNG